MRSILQILALGSALASLTAFAAEPARKQNADVLDFDADVIEGQKKAPDIFLQTDMQKPSIDTVLYQRRNFNDFHAADSKLRPRMADSPTDRAGTRKGR